MHFLQQVRDLVPESQAYMDLLAFERKLDATIMRKRLDIQVCVCVYLVNVQNLSSLCFPIHIFTVKSPLSLFSIFRKVRKEVVTMYGLSRQK